MRGGFARASAMAARSSREALGLIGPDVGLEPARLHGILDPHRRDVTARAALDRGALLERRRVPVPLRVDAHGRARIAPCVRSERVVVAIPAEVESGAGSHLAQPQRQAARARHVQEAAEQPCAAAHLVRLRKAREAREQRFALLGDDVAKGVPHAGPLGTAVRGRVVARERGRLAREHAFVHRPEHAQCDEGAQRVVCEVLDQARDRPVRLEILEGRVEQVGVQRRAEEPAAPGLEAKRREHRFGDHARRA